MSDTLNQCPIHSTNVRYTLVCRWSRLTLNITKNCSTNVRYTLVCRCSRLTLNITKNCSTNVRYTLVCRPLANPHKLRGMRQRIGHSLSNFWELELLRT